MCRLQIHSQALHGHAWLYRLSSALETLKHLGWWQELNTEDGQSISERARMRAPEPGLPSPRWLLCTSDMFK